MDESDYSRQRVIERGGETFTLEATDPYGFWHVKGTAKIFQQDFTGLSDALKAIDLYLHQKTIKATKETREMKRQKKEFPQEYFETKETE